MTLGPILCPILLGRDEILELADARLADASAGRGRFLLLAGEAGVGKTRLYSAILRRAEARGFATAEGAVAMQDRDVPGSLILDAARWMVKGTDFPTLGRALLQLRQDAGSAARPERRLLVGDIVDLITDAIDRPTMLGFEDLQWADDLSLEIMSELARRVRERPVLLIGDYRNDELGPRDLLRDWRARLLTQRLAEEVRLEPLSIDDTALATTLILNTGLPAPRDVVQAVYERTDGIPLHIEELLGVIGDTARSSSRAIRDAAVPDTIEDAVLERLRRRSPEAQAVARAGAVIGRCFVPEVLAGIMDLPLASLEAPLQELVDHSVLYPFSVGWFDFRHQLLRDALYRSIPAAQRRRFHARAAEYGAQLDGATEVHASVHFERAGLKPQAFRAALAGAQTAARLSSHREAFELYRRAVDNVPDDLEIADRAGLFAAYADEAAAIDQHETCEAAAHAARELFIAADRPVDAAAQLLTLAAIARREARPIESRAALIEQGLDELQPLAGSPARDRIRAHLLLERGGVELEQLDTEAASKTAEAARSAALAAGEPADDLEALALLGRVRALRGDVDAGLASIVRAARDARDAGYEDVGVSAYRDAATVALRMMAYEVAETSIQEGMRYADAIEQSHCRHVMGGAAGVVAWAGGHWDVALTTGGQELADRGCIRGAIGAKTALGFVALGRGELDEARSFLSDVADVGERSGSIDIWLPAVWGLAEADLLGRAPAAGTALCERAFDRTATLGERALLVPFVVTGVRAYHAAGEPDRAESWFARCGALLADAPQAAWPALDHGRGLIALAAGSTGIARGALEAAVRGWDERGRAWESAWARLDLATCLIRSNRAAEAGALISDVAASAAQLRSRPLASRAEELSQLARGRGSLDDAWRPLTAREFEVARLIRGGLTNGEIGGELGIATKTVSAHVEHILAKLGMARRAEVAAWVASVTRSRSAATPEAVGAGRR